MENNKTVNPLKATDLPSNPITITKKILIGVAVLVAIAIYIWSFQKIEFSPMKLVRESHNIWEFITGMFPPKWSIWQRVLDETVITIQLALVGTTFSVLVAFPLSFLAARNIAPTGIYHIVRFFFNSVRSIDTLVFALIFVAWVGLGPFPGMLALAVHSMGMLGKLFSEAIENIETGQVEALQSVGATKLEVVRWAVLPQVSSYFISYFLYRLEINIRAATVLGLVDAGGIGQFLTERMAYHDYQSVSVIIFTILALVMSIDALSNWLRRKLI